MDRKYYFISGLPRSGSTLLSAILQQNPRFTAGISDPLFSYAKNIDLATNSAAGMSALVPIDKRKEIVRGIFTSFYSAGRPVCFNTNRAWSSETSWLKSIWPDFKMIVCLRDVNWVLDSFERLNSLNPHTIKPLYHHQQLSNVYERSHMLMGGYANMAGYVAAPLTNVKHSFTCAERGQIFYLEYDHLVSNPEAVMAQVYAFLGEAPYRHDFNSVEAAWDEFDLDAKIEGLHTIRRKIEKTDRRTVLPHDLWQQYSGATTWKSGFEVTKASLNWSGGASRQGNFVPPQQNLRSQVVSRQL